MADVRLDGLLGEEQSLPDFTIHETVGNELEDLDLARCRILADLPRRRWRERDDRTTAGRTSPRGSGFEPPAVIAVPVQDLSALSSVHEDGIGGPHVPL
jgi:hypothetical protein